MEANIYRKCQVLVLIVLTAWQSILGNVTLTGNATIRGVAVVGTQSAIPPTPTEQEVFVGPFTSWRNVVTGCGAVGNGVADDTSAIETCMQAMGSGQPRVLYVPAGTYKITSTLDFLDKENVHIIGAHPTTTIIQWAGAASGTMHLVNGVSRASWGRITWDCASVSGVTGVAHKWDASGGSAPIHNKHYDSVYKNCSKGLVGGVGAGGVNDDTFSVFRSKFLNNSYAGMSMESYNALDWYVWDSEFSDNARGITNVVVNGSAHAYRNLFQRSTVADFQMAAIPMGIRWNVSIDSQMFFEASGCTANAGNAVIQENRIVTPIADEAIWIKTMGAVTLLDNQIRSRAGATAPIVDADDCGWTPGVDLITVGNDYTVSSPHAIAGNVRHTDVDTSIVSAASISATAPTLPATSTGSALPVTNLTVGASAATIQSAINAVAGSGGIIHLPAGTYSINTTITLPANSPIILVGDGREITELTWTGSAGVPLITMTGPSKSIIRDLTVNGGGAGKGILLDGVDQVGSTVYIDHTEAWGSTTNAVYVQDLNNTKVDFANLDYGHCNGAAISVDGGTSGLGSASRVGIWGGMSSIALSWVTASSEFYQLLDNAKLLVQDLWYEGHAPKYVNLTSADSGYFALSGTNVAPYVAEGGVWAIDVNAFNGIATFLGNRLDLVAIVRSAGANAGMTFAFLGTSNITTNTTWYTESATAGTRGFQHNARTAPGGGSVLQTSSGSSDSTFFTNALAFIRSARPDLLTDNGAGVTDARLYNLRVESVNIGIHVR